MVVSLVIGMKKDLLENSLVLEEESSMNIFQRDIVNLMIQSLVINHSIIPIKEFMVES